MGLSDDSRFRLHAPILHPRRRRADFEPLLALVHPAEASSPAPLFFPLPHYFRNCLAVDRRAETPFAASGGTVAGRLT
jgi:hypothetical protein